jgi:hypothetical protein
MNYDELSEEQKEKLKNCKTAEEIIALAQAEGYELSDDELDAMSGGCDTCPNQGPKTDRCRQRYYATH